MDYTVLVTKTFIVKTFYLFKNYLVEMGYI